MLFNYTTSRTGLEPGTKNVIREVWVDEMRMAGHSLRAISTTLGISGNSFYLWRQSVGYVDPITRLKEEDLDTLLLDYIEENCHGGGCLLSDYVRSLGYSVSMGQIYQSILRIDPKGVMNHVSEMTLVRDDIVETGPLNCVHIGTNIKLKSWNLIIHGGIDERTRELMFLKCSDNNRAQTLHTEFLRSCIEYDTIPWNIRTDSGGENFLIHHFMDNVVGDGRAARLADKANQRITRFWEWLNVKVLAFYIRAFENLEDFGFDIEDPLTLFCLHYLFIPRINEELLIFREAWSHHQFSDIVKEASPRELYIKHCELLPPPVKGFDMDNYAASFHDTRNYALDYKQVIVESCRSPFSKPQCDAFEMRVRPLSMNDKEECFLNRMDNAVKAARRLSRL